MKPKDYVVVTTDSITEALEILVRINYDNATQMKSNMLAARTLMLKAAAALKKGSDNV